MSDDHNYTPDGVDPQTYQRRVTIHHDLNGILFDNTNAAHEVPAGQEGVSAGIDIIADKDITLFIACTNAFTIVPQVTDDGGDDPDWYPLCKQDTTTLISISCTDAKLAVPLSVKAKKFRVVVTNGGATAEAPYIGVM